MEYNEESIIHRRTRREISEEDPFLGERPRFRRLYDSVYRTEDLIDKLKPYESRRFTDQNQLKRICDLETRFYTKHEEQLKKQLTLVN
jgi:hypothetical protein